MCSPICTILLLFLLICIVFRFTSFIKWSLIWIVQLRTMRTETFGRNSSILSPTLVIIWILCWCESSSLIFLSNRIWASLLWIPLLTPQWSTQFFPNARSNLSLYIFPLNRWNAVLYTSWCNSGGWRINSKIALPLVSPEGVFAFHPQHNFALLVWYQASISFHHPQPDQTRYIRWLL